MLSLEILFGIAGIVIGATITYCFNLKLISKEYQKQKKDRLKRELYIRIEEIEKVTREYWLKDYSEDDKSLEVQLKTLGRIIPTISKKTKQLHIDIDSLDEFSNKIFDDVTGGDFESKCRKSEGNRVLKISNRCMKVKTDIMIS